MFSKNIVLAQAKRLAQQPVLGNLRHTANAEAGEEASEQHDHATEGILDYQYRPTKVG